MATKTLIREHLLQCAECGSMIDAAAVNSGRPWRCGCGHETVAWAFPAAAQETKGIGSAAPVVAEEASCLYHPGNQASEYCSRCGSYVCAICDVEVYGEHYCPPCIEKAVASGDTPQFKNRYSTGDNIALRVAAAPYAIFLILALIIVPAQDFDWSVLAPILFVSLGSFGVFAAPFGVGLSIRALANRENFAVPRGRWRARLALILSGGNALLLLVGLVALVYGLIMEMQSV